MEVLFNSSFKKVFRKRIKGCAVEDTFWEKTEMFIADPFHPQLKVHKLSGTLKGLWSFSVDHSLRVIFYFENENPPKAVFVDIGNHDQVY